MLETDVFALPFNLATDARVRAHLPAVPVFNGSPFAADGCAGSWASAGYAVDTDAVPACNRPVARSMMLRAVPAARVPVGEPLATEGRPLVIRRTLASHGIDASAIDRTTFLAMPENVYAAVFVLAVRSAARGRIVGSIGKRADVPLPPPRAVEDDETATDAIGTVWAMLLETEHPRPVLLCRAIARRLGQRRAQHRLRERTGLVDAPTDGKVPALDASATVAELIARAPAHRRALLRDAIAKRALADHRRGGRPLKAGGALTGAERAARHRAKHRVTETTTAPV